MLDEVEVARGDAKARGKRLLGQAALGAEATDGAADERLCHWPSLHASQIRRQGREAPYGLAGFLDEHPSIFLHRNVNC